MIIPYLTVIILALAPVHATETKFQLKGSVGNETIASQTIRKIRAKSSYSGSCSDFSKDYPTVPFSASAYEACSFYHELSKKKYGKCGEDEPLDGQPNDDKICHARGGECHVAFTEPGEWLEYTFDVEKSSVSHPVYNIVARVASLTPKAFAIEVDNGGDTIRKEFKTPGKGYFDFEDIIWDRVPISDNGLERIFVDFIDGNTNFCSITVEETSSLSLHNKELTIPFDESAQNYLTFVEKTRRRDGNCGPGPVDAQPTRDHTCNRRGSHCNIGWTERGEEVTYWVENDKNHEVKKDVKLRLASNRRNREVEVEIEGRHGSQKFKTQGRGYQNFHDYKWKNVRFPPGYSRLIVKFLDSGINMCSVSVE